MRWLIIEELFSEIIDLIELKQEGGYWDFKKKWYVDDNKGKQDMLHDIICMANNLENRDAYLIIGIDEEHDYSVENVESDVNRRNTQQIVDFLRGKKFAGDQRPVVSVKTLSFPNGKVDVVIIHNSNKTPFYLKEKFQGVFANNIYVRTQDSNTPINASADVQHVELLWKKRFGMLLTPIEKFKLYLEDRSGWASSPTNESMSYYKQAPEYTITHTLEPRDGRNGHEYYLFHQTDSTPRWSDIELKYYQTVLVEMGGAILDGGRYFTNCPITEVLAMDHYHQELVPYKYFVKDTLEYVVHEFFYQTRDGEERIAHNRFLDCILIFETEEEHQWFNYFVEENWCMKDQYDKDITLPYFGEIEGCNMNVYEEEYRNVQIIKNMLTEFRKNNGGL